MLKVTGALCADDYCMRHGQPVMPRGVSAALLNVTLAGLYALFIWRHAEVFFDTHELPLLATGDTVRHKAWGEGVVIQVATAEEVVVRFPGQGEKRLHVAYAPIEKV